MKVFLSFALLNAIASTNAFYLSSHCGPKRTVLGFSKQSDDLESQRNRRDFLIGSAASLVASSSFAQNSVALNIGGKPQYGDEEIMTSKAHGTSEKPVQSDLLYGVSNSLADRICNFNRHFAEQAGYFQSTSFTDTVLKSENPITFYDSVTGKPLFVAPVGRSQQEFLAESRVHGWPSFRDEEVVWENVRVLRRSGETVSVDGTHLGKE